MRRNDPDSHGHERCPLHVGEASRDSKTSPFPTFAFFSWWGRCRAKTISWHLRTERIRTVRVEARTPRIKYIPMREKNSYTVSQPLSHDRRRLFPDWMSANEDDRRRTRSAGPQLDNLSLSRSLTSLVREPKSCSSRTSSLSLVSKVSARRWWRETQTLHGA